ncbi:MAG: leucine efflux protein LeuE, partial [Nevskia sp.]|nr:leucine efflux protein LeuE [Nevskia sp.]
MNAASLGVVHLPTYLLGTLIVILLPGPNSLFVLSTSAQRGVRQGFRAACGVFAGDTVLTVLASAGVASLLRAYPALFTLVKFAGAAYLGYVGTRMLVGAWRGQARRTVEPESASERPAERSDPLRRALLISLLNPKAILFFVAFFIQFVDPTYPHKALSFALLGALAQLMSAAYLSTLVLGGAHLAAAFRRRRRARSALSGAAGALFVGFGVKLATASVG